MKWDILLKEIIHFQVVFMDQITKTIKYYSSVLTKGK